MEARSWHIAATAFQFVAVLGVVYLPAGCRARVDGGEAAAGARAASRLYTLLAGAGAALYWLVALHVLRGGAAGATETLQRLRADVAASGALRFLLLDFAGLSLTALLLVAHEAPPAADAAAAVARGVAWAALLSPAAPLALWLAEREHRALAEAVPDGRPRLRKRAPTPAR